MSGLFKIDSTSLFGTIITDAESAAAVAGKATSYVVVAEQIGRALGLTGPQKLDAVKDMMLADLRQSWPAGADWVEKEWPRVAGVISALVSLFNTLGWMFEAAAPIISAADPGAAPAIAAISGALQAAQALQSQVKGTAPVPTAVPVLAPAKLEGAVPQSPPPPNSPP